MTPKELIRRTMNSPAVSYRYNMVKAGCEFVADPQTMCSIWRYRKGNMLLFKTKKVKVFLQVFYGIGIHSFDMPLLALMYMFQQEFSPSTLRRFLSRENRHGSGAVIQITSRGSGELQRGQKPYPQGLCEAGPRPHEGCR